MSHQEGQGLDLRSLSVEALEQLKYTSCVIKETLRMNPPVPGGFRVALKTFKLGVGEKNLHLQNDQILTLIATPNHHFAIPVSGLSNSQRLERCLQYL